MSDTTYQDLVTENTKKMYGRTPIKETVFDFYFGTETDIKFGGIKELPTVLCFPDGTKKVIPYEKEV